MQVGTAILEDTWQVGARAPVAGGGARAPAVLSVPTPHLTERMECGMLTSSTDRNKLQPWAGHEWTYHEMTPLCTEECPETVAALAHNPAPPENFFQGSMWELSYSYTCLVLFYGEGPLTEASRGRKGKESRINPGHL